MSSSRQAAIWYAISFTTQSPMCSMTPISSASGMKSPGGTIVPSGSTQRMRASTPIIRPESSSTTGW